MFPSVFPSFFSQPPIGESPRATPRPDKWGAEPVAEQLLGQTLLSGAESLDFQKGSHGMAPQLPTIPPNGFPQDVTLFEGLSDMSDVMNYFSPLQLGGLKMPPMADFNILKNPDAVSQALRNVRSQPRTGGSRAWTPRKSFTRPSFPTPLNDARKSFTPANTQHTKRIFDQMGVIRENGQTGQNGHAGGILGLQQKEMSDQRTQMSDRDGWPKSCPSPSMSCPDLCPSPPVTGFDSDMPDVLPPSHSWAKQSEPWSRNMFAQQTEPSPLGTASATAWTTHGQEKAAPPARPNLMPMRKDSIAAMTPIVPPQSDRPRTLCPTRRSPDHMKTDWSRRSPDRMVPSTSRKSRRSPDLQNCGIETVNLLDDKCTKKRRMLDRKAQLAKHSRLRKKKKLEMLEITVNQLNDTLVQRDKRIADLEKELEQYRKHIGNVTTGNTVDTVKVTKCIDAGKIRWDMQELETHIAAIVDNDDNCTVSSVPGANRGISDPGTAAFLKEASIKNIRVVIPKYLNFYNQLLESLQMHISQTDKAIESWAPLQLLTTIVEQKDNPEILGYILLLLEKSCPKLDLNRLFDCPPFLDKQLIIYERNRLECKALMALAQEKTKQMVKNGKNLIDNIAKFISPNELAKLIYWSRSNAMSACKLEEMCQKGC